MEDEMMPLASPVDQSVVYSVSTHLYYWVSVSGTTKAGLEKYKIQWFHLAPSNY